MKKVISILMVVVLLSLTGCSQNAKVENKNTYFYFGQSKSWFATYSITKDKSSYYDSLSIQYLFNDNSKNQTEKIGPIEYQLTGNSMKIQSLITFYTGGSKAKKVELTGAEKDDFMNRLLISEFYRSNRIGQVDGGMAIILISKDGNQDSFEYCGAGVFNYLTRAIYFQ